MGYQSPIRMSGVAVAMDEGAACATVRKPAAGTIAQSISVAAAAWNRGVTAARERVESSMARNLPSRCDDRIMPTLTAGESAAA